jgi:hypothetical protein
MSVVKVVYDLTCDVVSFSSWPSQPSSTMAVAAVIAASATAAMRACMFFMVKESGLSTGAQQIPTGSTSGKRV